jgi:hypothetical protein
VYASVHRSQQRWIRRLRRPICVSSGGVAQQAEQQTFNLTVAGSIPAALIRVQQVTCHHGSITSMDVTVKEFQKSATERIVAKIREFRGRRYVDIRVYYLANISDNTYAPTKKGIMLSADLLPDLSAMIQDLATACGGDGSGSHASDG